MARWAGMPALGVDFATNGLSLYRSGSWQEIESVPPSLMLPYRSSLVASLPGIGLRQYNGAAWKTLSPDPGAQGMVAIGTKLFVDFGASGLYRYDGKWTRIKAANANQMMSFGSKLVASFPDQGLFAYDGKAWTCLSKNTQTEALVATPYMLCVDRGAGGLYQYEKKKWSRIHQLSPEHMCIYAGKLVAAFPTQGVLQYDKGKWTTLKKVTTAEAMVGLFFD